MPKEKFVYLTRKETFSASHRLLSKQLSDEENKRVFGKCYNVNGHGHNYVIEVTLKHPIDPVTGMIINLIEIKDILEKHVLEKVDHRHINMDVPEFRELNPTVENMAVVFWNWLENKFPAGMLHEVKLYETEHNFAAYRGENS